MTNEPNNTQTKKKKLSLQELMKQQLTAKKQEKNKNHKGNYSTATKSLTSQLTKKPNNQRKRTGV